MSKILNHTEGHTRQEMNARLWSMLEIIRVYTSNKQCLFIHEATAGQSSNWMSRGLETIVLASAGSLASTLEALLQGDLVQNGLSWCTRALECLVDNCQQAGRRLRFRTMPSRFSHCARSHPMSHGQNQTHRKRPSTPSPGVCPQLTLQEMSPRPILKPPEQHFCP